MTTADVTRTVAPHEAQNLRRRVRSLLEGEYLRLRAADRPELLMSAADVEAGIDPDVLAGEMGMVNRRIDALERHFAAASDHSAPAYGRVFLLDLGDGPQLMLVSEVDVADDQVIAADSPLGRALHDAVPGQLVTYQCPRELRQARVLAVEADAANARAEWYSLPAAEVMVGSDGSPAPRTANTCAGQQAARREDGAGFGPVARDVVTSAARATVGVPPRAEPKLHGRVVVGLREAHQCADALAVGFAEADRRGADLIVMLIRDDDTHAAVGNSLDPLFHAPNAGDVEEAGHLPVAVAAAGRAFPDVSVRTVVRTGRFAEVLVDRSHSADLVVLGMGERPAGMGRKDLLIASHSTCPVIVVLERLIQGGI